jgi:predicted 3-demethylubiquinone-9 3-methyltransferase (glyoxalase superfamily)
LEKITPNLWFDGNAEEAATFYVSLFPDSRIDQVVRSPADNPSTARGEVVVVEFTLAGQPYAGINGGPQYSFTEAVSFAIECDDQAEVDRYWDLLIADGGSAGRCGWCKDRFGLSWQITPKRLRQLLASPDREAAERTMQAMLGMEKIETAALERAFRGE